MKILSFLNVSNKDDIQCDSGYVFQRLMASQLIKEGHEFCLASPVAIDDNKASHEQFDFGANKFQVRFNFDWEHIEKIIQKYDPDILWINQPELAANFRAILCTINSNADLITYIHYLPIQDITECSVQLDESLNNANLGIPILLAVLGSVSISDKILVQSQFAKGVLLRALQIHQIPYHSDKIFIVPPPYDPRLFADGKVNQSLNKFIIYNHRLYKHYGTDFLIKIIKSLEEKSDIQFFVADLLASRNGTRQKLDPHVDLLRSELRAQPNVRFARNTDNRDKYKKVIKNCRVGLAAHRQMAVWSMSAVDCLGLGVPVIAPNFASYPEFIPSPLLYNSLPEFQDILDNLLLSETFWQKCSEEGRQMVGELSPSKIAQKFTEIICA